MGPATVSPSLFLVCLSQIVDSLCFVDDDDDVGVEE